MEWIQHSSGPWKLEGPDYVCGGYNVPRWRVRDSHGEPIGELYAFNGADARRTVACVNACEGIPTGALEAGVVQPMVKQLDLVAKGLLDEIERLRRERAQAASLIRSAIEWIYDESTDEWAWDDSDLRHAVDELRQAIDLLCPEKGGGGA